jgi:hypothetical protein
MLVVFHLPEGSVDLKMDSPPRVGEYVTVMDDTSVVKSVNWILSVGPSPSWHAVVAATAKGEN